MSERGKYIVIEGSDGTGKSTQVNRLVATLSEIGIQSLLTTNPDNGLMEPVQEPGGTPTANILRKRIKDASIPRTPWENVEWFTEARASSWNELMKPALEEGLWVPTARSVISTEVYQGHGQGISIEKIREYTLDQVGEEYMNPDLEIILALYSEEARQQRIMNRSSDHKNDTFESLPESFQRSVQAGYLKYADEKGLTPIDASKNPDEVAKQIWAQVEKLL